MTAPAQTCMAHAHAEQRDPLTSGAITIAWLIVANKPFYPLYVWWIAGHGLAPAFLTALSAPAFAGLIWLARKNSLWLRAGIPLLGAVDTMLATKLFGAGAGTELFFLPCVLLVATSIRPSEYRVSWALAALILLAAVLMNGRYGAPLYEWPGSALAGLFSLNVMSVACLCFVIVYRFSKTARA